VSVLSFAVTAPTPTLLLLEYPLLPLPNSFNGPSTTSVRLILSPLHWSRILANLCKQEFPIHVKMKSRSRYPPPTLELPELKSQEGYKGLHISTLTLICRNQLLSIRVKAKTHYRSYQSPQVAQVRPCYGFWKAPLARGSPGQRSLKTVA